MYREHTSRLPGAVVWSNTTAGAEQRILPDGCMDVIWVDGELIVAGPDTRAFVNTVPAGTNYVGLRFPPGTGPDVLGLPAHELRDQRVPLDAVWAATRVRRIAEQIGGANDAAGVLQTAARDAWPASGSRASWARTIVDSLRAGNTVAGAADAVGVSERQLHRRCRDAFGYGPKWLARVLRMQRALDLARAGVPFAETAARTGYADQAHLARDVKDLAGTTLGALTR